MYKQTWMLFLLVFVVFSSHGKTPEGLVHLGNPGMVLSDTSSPALILVVIDGVRKVIKNQRDSLDNVVKPEEIESMKIIKGEEAIRKYGKEWENGVIEVKSKVVKIHPRAENSTEIKDVKIESVDKDPDNKIFTEVEIPPSFPGGNSAWVNYLMQNLNTSVAINNGAPTGTYSVVIQFVVLKNGKLSDVKAITNQGYGMEEEAIRILKKGPDWQPAVQNGKKVNSLYRKEIKFVSI